jgi:acetolactate decarboxylase
MRPSPLRSLFFCALGGLFFAGIYAQPLQAVSPAPQGELFQYSVLDALSQGVFDGELTVAQLRKKGNFGLGTFDHLDGEMIMLDRVVYQIQSNGNVQIAGDGQKLPFAMAVSATGGGWQALGQNLGLTSMQGALDMLAPRRNHFYAFVIEGLFARVGTRSVPAQSKPYSTLAKAVKGQVLFSAENIQGTLVGLRSPSWSQGLNLPGYHFHFISADHSFGGHVLSLQLLHGRVKVVPLGTVKLQIPDTPDFDHAELLPSGSQAPSGATPGAR